MATSKKSVIMKPNNVFKAWAIYRRGKIYRDWEDNPMIFKTKDRAENEAANCSMADEGQLKIKRILVTISIF